MKEQEPVQPSDQSTILHLDKFIPNQPPGLPAPENPASDTVTSLVQQASRQTCEQSTKAVVAPKENNALSGPSLLGVLSYCYSKNVCSSADIESKLVKDPQIRAACGAEVPNRRVLRRFRRFNREAIQATLEKIFRFRRKKEKAALIPTSAATDLAGAPGAKDDQPGESTILFAKQEAAGRIEKAIFLDSMEQDE